MLSDLYSNYYYLICQHCIVAAKKKTGCPTYAMCLCLHFSKLCETPTDKPIINIYKYYML